MGLFDKIVKKEEPKKKPVPTKEEFQKRDKKMEVDVIPFEEDEIAKELVKPQIRYIKKIVVTSYSDLERISSELQTGNIVIVDLTPIEGKIEILEKVVEQIKGMTHALDGGIAKISKCEAKLIVTPPDIKIAKE